MERKRKCKCGNKQYHPEELIAKFWYEKEDELDYTCYFKQQDAVNFITNQVNKPNYRLTIEAFKAWRHKNKIRYKKNNCDDDYIFDVMQLKHIVKCIKEYLKNNEVRQTDNIHTEMNEGHIRRTEKKLYKFYTQYIEDRKFVMEMYKRQQMIMENLGISLGYSEENEVAK